MSSPPPTLVGRQGPFRVDLPLEALQKHLTRPRSGAPGVVGSMQQMGSDTASQCPFGGAGSMRAPSHHNVWRRSSARFADGAPAAASVVRPSHSRGSPATVTMIGS